MKRQRTKKKWYDWGSNQKAHVTVRTADTVALRKSEDFAIFLMAGLDRYRYTIHHSS
jgi:hypothetical protein